MLFDRSGPPTPSPPTPGRGTIAAMKTPSRSRPSRKALLVLLFAQAACSQLTLPPGDGTSLADRRRTLGDDGATGIVVVPATVPADKAASGDAPPTSTGAIAGDPSDSPGSAERSAPSGRSMGEAKQLSDPDLGIRIPIGQPALTPRQHAQPD